MLLSDGLKGEVISILAKRFPLRVAEIEKTLFSVRQRQVSKQAIHKVLRQLLVSEIIKKDGQAYQLHPDFIIQLEKEIHRIREHYFGRSEDLFSIRPNRKRVFSSNSLLQHDNLWNSIISAKIREYPAGKFPYLQHAPHAWFSLSNTEAEIQVTDLITARCKGFYTLVNGNSSLDRWIERFYQTENSFYAVRGESLVREENHQYAVIGSYVLEARYPKELSTRLHRIFERTHNLSQVNLQELIAVVNMPADLTITVWNDRRRAARLGKEVLRHFS